uniref:Uncharacterized protein n=1 Tax=Physcomitrium patens TaxID=3218 RepID=A0A2K1KHK3_PHYPA|nr:hypothetical protein PHYPA_009619 [Physcomitrium patens]
MYKVGAKRLSMEVQKSFSMPMLIVDHSELYSESSTCPSLRCKLSMYLHRKAKSAISLCVGIVLCAVVLSVLTFALDLWKVSEAPRLLVSFPCRLWNYALLVKPGDVVAGRRPEMIVMREEEAALEGKGIPTKKENVECHRLLLRICLNHNCQGSKVICLRDPSERPFG